jgi:hypothetical protein
MKNTMRKIHLYSGLSLLGFMVMYFLSGFMIFEGKLFPSSDPDRRTQMLQVEIPSGLDLDQTGAWLAEHYELGGKPQPPRTFDNGKVRYAFNRPGIAIQATLDSGRDRVEIITARGDYRNTMVGYHRMHGYGTNVVWTIWAVMYDLASLGCIVFALSGIWIWAAARERDRTSWVMFILGWGMTIGMIMYLMLSR